MSKRVPGAVDKPSVVRLPGGPWAACALAAVVALAVAVWVMSWRDRPMELTNHVRIGQHVFRVELAMDNAARAHGMAGRLAVPHDFAMLFAYPAPEPAKGAGGFWMKGCLVDLDIAFISPERRIVTVHTMKAEPGVADADLQRYEPTADYQFVLEFRAGELARRGIAIGDEVLFSPAVTRAIAKAR